VALLRLLLTLNEAYNQVVMVFVCFNEVSVAPEGR
jgi:hypothetical protein